MKRTDRIIFQHAQWPVCAWSDEGLVVSCHGHGDEADGYGAGFCYLDLLVLGNWAGELWEEIAYVFWPFWMVDWE
jgi:hypothetical protein